MHPLFKIGIGFLSFGVKLRGKVISFRYLTADDVVVDRLLLETSIDRLLIDKGVLPKIFRKVLVCERTVCQSFDKTRQ